MADLSRNEPPGPVGRVPAVAGAVTMTAGVLVLVGWHREFSLLIEVAPALPSMKANTALSCVFAGASLLGSRAVRDRLRVLAVVPLLVGSATLVEWWAGVSLGIDELLVDDPFAVTYPGRAAPQVAAALALFGVARLAEPCRGRSATSARSS